MKSTVYLTVATLLVCPLSSYAVDMKSVFEEKKVDNLQKQAPEKKIDTKKKAVIKNKDKEKKKRRKEKSSNSQAIDPILLPEQNITEQEKTEIANPTEIVEPIEQPKRKCFKLWGKDCFFGN